MGGGSALSERRSSNRIPVNIDARFFWGNMFYSGTITNLSENGMLIKTNVDISCGESFIVLLSEEQDIPKLVARVKRIARENRISSSIGVEIISPSLEYAGFVEDLESCLYI
jgi:hypothetical protein